MKTYNGYTSSERSKAGRYQNKLLKAGSLVNPDRCEICYVSHKETGKVIQRHNENYTDMMAFYPVCERCHLRLHNRFNNWENWKQIIVHEYTRNQCSTKEIDLTAYGNEWFHSLKSYEEPEKRMEYEALEMPSPNQNIDLAKTFLDKPKFQQLPKTPANIVVLRDNNKSDKQYSWERFLKIVEKARKDGKIGRDPDDVKEYFIRDVNTKKIVFSVSGKKDVELGARGFDFFMKHFDNSQNKYPVNDYKSKGDDKMEFIVAFHPDLNWSESYQFIIRS